MLRSLDSQGLLTNASAHAFMSVPREKFVPPQHIEFAYSDVAIPLKTGSTISQPSMLAIMLRELQLFAGARVLEIGSGSGYMLALMHAMGAVVEGVEIDSKLAEISRQTLRSLGIEAVVHSGDASSVGLDQPFDRVLFSAAISRVPEWAAKLLTPEGFVLAHVGDEYEQELIRAYQDRTERVGVPCRFVPFIKPPI